MIKILIYLIVNVLALLLLDNLLGDFGIKDVLTAVIFVALLTLLNSTVLPIIKFFTWPINFITFGLVNVVLSLIAIFFSANIIQGVELKSNFLGNILIAFLISITLSVATSLANHWSEGNRGN